jgi:two-component system nitrate/nitrite response regulator NarL
MAHAIRVEDGIDRQSEGRRPTGILIVTPIKLYRDGIAHFLRSCAGVEVLGAAEESATTIRRALELFPDVILLDMALEFSWPTARALHQALPQTAIVAMAIPESEDHVLGCAEAGICGYVTRDASLEDLLTAVIRAASGEALCPPRIAGGLFRRVAALSSAGSERAPVQPSARLTAREAEVLALIDDGLSNKQISRRLYIEVPTVKNHVHSILDKLGARSRSEAAARVRTGVR